MSLAEGKNKLSLVSVVIPSYNHALYVKQAVESVLGQTHRDLELIVIDDGSTDNSLDYLRGVSDPRFTLVEQLNSGAHNAINRGLSLARGDYLTILNSDDIYHPQRLERCLQELRDDIDLVATWIEVINNKGKVLGVKEGWRNMLPWPVKPLGWAFRDDDIFKINLLLTNFVSTTSNVIFSRRLYECVGGMRNLRFAHDWDFLLRAAEQFRCKLVESPLLQYRIHERNTISSDRAWMLYEICWIYAVHLESMMLTLADKEGNVGFYKLFQSINLQGNDRVLWMLLVHLQQQKDAGALEPESELLDDATMRCFFTNQISAA